MLHALHRQTIADSGQHSTLSKCSAAGEHKFLLGFMSASAVGTLQTRRRKLA